MTLPDQQRGTLESRRCAVPDCEKPAFSRGWCHTHYEHWRRRGTPVYVAPTPEERFWKSVDKTSTCWLWGGPRQPNGYGTFSVNNRRRLAHRWAYEHFVGTIPDGLTIDHLCRVRNCVNPEHMEPVTGRENTLRGEAFSAVNARKSHCKKGHPLEGENLYARYGWRWCRQCRKDDLDAFLERNPDYYKKRHQREKA